MIARHELRRDSDKHHTGNEHHEKDDDKKTCAEAAATFAKNKTKNMYSDNTSSVAFGVCSVPFELNAPLRQSAL